MHKTILSTFMIFAPDCDITLDIHEILTEISCNIFVISDFCRSVFCSCINGILSNEVSNFHPKNNSTGIVTWNCKWWYTRRKQTSGSNCPLVLRIRMTREFVPECEWLVYLGSFEVFNGKSQCSQCSDSDTRHWVPCASEATYNGISNCFHTLQIKKIYLSWFANFISS